MFYSCFVDKFVERRQVVSIGLNFIQQVLEVGKLVVETNPLPCFNFVSK